MRRERCPHIVGRGDPEASFWRRGFVVHHLRVWPSGHHLWGHGGHVGVRGSWPVGWRKTLHVRWWGDWRTLQWNYSGPCAKQTTRRGLDVSQRTTWRYAYLVTHGSHLAIEEVGTLRDLVIFPVAQTCWVQR